jgi:hypothetical protein
MIAPVQPDSGVTSRRVSVAAVIPTFPSKAVANIGYSHAIENAPNGDQLKSA